MKIIHQALTEFSLELTLFYAFLAIVFVPVFMGVVVFAAAVLHG